MPERIKNREIHMKTIYTTLIVILASVIVVASISANLIAYTEDGRKVLLKDNGTWEFIKDKQKDTNVYDFRKAKWGVSIEEVKRIETSKLLTDTPIDGELMYEGKVAGMKCTIHYKFIDGILTSAGYFLHERHSSHNLYVKDYYKITKLLDKKYGKSEEERVWQNPQSVYREVAHRDDGMAIAIGDLVIRNQWEATNTAITAGIIGDNFKINTLINYDSKIHKKRVEKKAEDEDLADF